MKKTLYERAIQSALKQDWHDAIEANLELLLEDPHDIATLNRLAKAYKEVDQDDKAKETYEQVLKIDRYNSIAQKNLDILGQKKNGAKQSYPVELNTNFIEEPGKTKSFKLTRLGDPQLISSLQPGQVVKLIAKNHSVCISTTNEIHIGALTDDVAYTLKDFIAAGNEYQALVKSAGPKSVTVFIRELKRSDTLRDTPTFA